MAVLNPVPPVTWVAQCEICKSYVRREQAQRRRLYVWKLGRYNHGGIFRLCCNSCFEKVRSKAGKLEHCMRLVNALQEDIRGAA